MFFLPVKLFVVVPKGHILTRFARGELRASFWVLDVARGADSH
jgi:hypothetical protein